MYIHPVMYIYSYGWSYLHTMHNSPPSSSSLPLSILTLITLQKYLSRDLTSHISHLTTQNIIISISFAKFSTKRCIDLSFLIWNDPALPAFIIFACFTFFAVFAVSAAFVAFAIFAVIIITFAFTLKIRGKGEMTRKSRHQYRSHLPHQGQAKVAIPRCHRGLSRDGGFMSC